MEPSVPSRGFVVLPRGLLDDLGISTAREPFCRRAALVWLIETAAWAERQVVIAGRAVTLRRGQLHGANRYLAGAWGWEETRVRRFLDLLVKRALIRIEVAAGQQVIGFVDFDRFQAQSTAARSPNDRRATASAEILKCEDDIFKESKSGDPTAARPPNDQRAAASIFNKGNEQKEEEKEGVAPNLRLVAPAAAPPAPPSRPDPRGTRLPVDWVPSSADVEYASRLRLNVETTLANFRDYWLAKAGRDARKTDWSRVWQSWCRRDAERQPAHSRAPLEDPVTRRRQEFLERRGLAPQPQPPGPDIGGPIIEGRVG